MPSSDYRPCVCAVFVATDGKILLAERADRDGAWQLPQGGVDKGETAEQALFREMEEELGCEHFEILKTSDAKIRYRWAPGMKGHKNYVGQEQTWFLTQFLDGHGPDLENAKDREFQSWKWSTPQEAIDTIAEFKREAYIQGFRSLGLGADD